MNSQHAPRVLSLLPQLRGVTPWDRQITSIDAVDPEWQQRSVLAQARQLARLAPQFDWIVVYQDVRLSLLFRLLALLRLQDPRRTELLFVAMLCDVSRFQAPGWDRRGLYDQARQLYYILFTRLHTRIVVHSRAEVKMYAHAFRSPPERFCFIPFYVPPEAFAKTGSLPAGVTAPYVLCAGRHRDVATFCAALRDSSYCGILVAGAEERSEVERVVPPNVTAFFELPRADYRALIARAKVLVIPLSADRWQRSLGQIAALEAAARGVPIIAARTFQLADYFTDEQEILSYEPGSPADLRQQMERLQTDHALCEKLTSRALTHAVTCFTRERYTGALWNIVREASA